MDVIIGAGLSGLICAALNARALVFERNPSSFVTHRAVLRFRDDKIARALGLNFRKVTVRKGIFLPSSGFLLPNPQLANLYSKKVRGVIGENSLWNIATSERFIAPDNLHSILADIVGSRVKWGTEIQVLALAEFKQSKLQIVNTTPLPLLLQLLRVDSALDFSYAPIFVSRYVIPNCDVFQTIYFPAPDCSIYRATLTGELLTVERTDQARGEFEDEIVAHAFGIDHSEMARGHQLQSSHRQSFGKITPVLDGPRKALLHRLTLNSGIYSLGRFATWRNILLDDVFDDIAVIRRMMTQDSYDTNIERTKL